MRSLPIRNTKNGYGLIAIAFHWALALLVVGQLGLGLAMLRVPSRRLEYELIQWHKSFGILILALFTLRLLWRLANPAPAPAVSLRRWEKVAASGVHRLLYAVFLGLPLTGWALVSTSVLAIPTLVFGLFVLPHLPVGVSAGAEALWRSLHQLLAYAAIAMVAFHALAALRHHFLLRDGVLKRMLRPTAHETVNGPSARHE